MFHSFHQRAWVLKSAHSDALLYTHCPKKKKKENTTTRNLDKLPTLWAHTQFMAYTCRNRLPSGAQQWAQLFKFLFVQSALNASLQLLAISGKVSVACPFNLINIPNTNTGKQMHVTNGFNLCPHSEFQSEIVA